MNSRSITRRTWLKAIGMGGLAAAAGSPESSESADRAAVREDDHSRESDDKPQRVAAIQMHAQLGDVDANLETAEKWARHALRLGARYIVLPELFTSGNGFDPSKMLDAHRPLNGEPMQLLKRLATDGNAIVGGSYLAKSGDDVYNTFVLVLPDGRTFTHDKDFPSSPVESSFYAGGEDDEFVRELKRHGVETPNELVPPRSDNIKSGVFPLPGGTRVGTAMCWELVRYRTARRLREGSVDLVLAGSAWPFLDPEVGAAGLTQQDLRQEYELARTMIRQAPIRLARSLGVPVVHANLVGDSWALQSTDRKTPILFRFYGESQIVDGQGTVLNRRPYSEGEGVVMAEMRLGRTSPTATIPADEFWIPEVSELSKFWWYNGSGREYYLDVTRPHRNK